MGENEELIVILIATLKITANIAAELSEQGRIQSARASDCAVELKRAAEALDQATRDPEHPDKPPNDLASRLHTVALLLESRAGESGPQSQPE